jgi:hypothetical protein
MRLSARSSPDRSASPGTSPREEAAEQQEIAEATARAAKVSAAELTLLDLYGQPEFSLRAGLYAAGIVVLHVGLLVRYSDLVYVLTAPGWCLLGGWFVLECRANKDSIARGDRDRWKGGNSGGSFFMGIALLVAVLSSLQVSSWCPIQGNELVAARVADADAMVSTGGRANCLLSMVACAV